jgi:hypothetical protein
MGMVTSLLKRHVAVYTDSKISSRAINWVLLYKGWNFSTLRMLPLIDSEAENHWVLLKSFAPNNKNVELR